MEIIGSIKFSLVFEKQWWVGIFERVDDAGYAVAREIFGTEPTDPEIYEFILHNQGKLKFSHPLTDGTVSIIRKINPKRMMREAKQQQAKLQNMTKAYDALRIEMEKNKKEKKCISAQENEKIKRYKFELKQKKRKAKHQGH